MARTVCFLVFISLVTYNLGLTTVDYAPPRVTEPSYNGLVYYHDVGDSVNITCQAKGNPQPTYRWLLNSKELYNSETIDLNSTSGLLKIVNFSSLHQGELLCIASNFFMDADGKKKTVSNFAYPIKIILERVNISTESRVEVLPVTQFSYMTITCPESKINEGVSYVWYGQDQRQITYEIHDRRYVDRKGTLHFSYILKKDVFPSNAFNCSVIDRKGRSHVSPIQYQLNVTKVLDDVRIPPVIKYTSLNPTGLINGSVTLECVFSGRDLLDPHIPVVMWYKNDKVSAISASAKYNLTSDYRTLTILNLTEDDEGQYYCTASISLVNSTTDFVPVFVNVTSPPIFQANGSPRDQIVKESSHANFTCNTRPARGDLAPNKPNWFINGETLASPKVDSKFEVSLDGKTLTISFARKTSDVMCVQCRVDNSIGSTWGNACLQITASSYARSTIRFTWLYDSRWSLVLILTLYTSVFTTVI